ncbi:hypothetical protein [Labedella endophytica]|uniref:DUF998 domain-containing protein n=1 Tax=Labedella endophytica TaxID=1523160 RepID=A0A3S0X780_9MICO|nr:hypothetical protein [Labedella endophytica]RUR00956.1 hypothetical protein ELQ94_05290 [Labedella endophytica]
MESGARAGSARPGVRADAPVLALLGLLVLVAGGLEGFASWIRWAPCLEVSDTLECVRVMDHSRDYAIVSEPFELIPLAVPLAGSASLLLVTFWAVVAAAPWADGWSRVLALVSAVTLVVVGAGQLLASMSDGRLGVLGSFPAAVMFWVLLFAPVVAAARLALRSARTVIERVAWITMALSVAVGNQLSEFFLLYPFSDSHDTPVGGGMPHAVLVGVAGVVFSAASIVVWVGRDRRAPELASVEVP